MKHINGAIGEIYKIDEAASRDKWLNNVHPLAKLIVTIYYIATVVSFDRYDIAGLLGMVIYPVVLFIVGEINFLTGIRRMKLVFPVICFIGVLNPVFDREILFYVEGFAVTTGLISMVTLMIKGVLTVLSAYLLIATTTIEKICFALRMIHIPKVIVTIIMLIYRYIVLLMQEVDRLSQAYSLRAPKQKGINIKAWGPFVGQLVLRSMDRAEAVYESMSLRGFNGEIASANVKKFNGSSAIYMLVCVGLITVFRWVPVSMMIGNILM